MTHALDQLKQFANLDLQRAARTGIPEVVRPDQTGLSVPPCDAPGLAAALGRLLDDSRLRVALATQARALVEREFDVRRTSGQLRDVLGAAARIRVPAEVV